MPLTARQLALATLDRQLLLERRRIDVAEAVRQVCALQAQAPASPYLALWNRVQDFVPEDLDTAFADHRIVKATLMRVTLHAVHAEDYVSYYAAMASTLRASRLYDRRFTSTELTDADADELLPQLAGFLARPHTGAEVEEEVAGQLGEHAHRLWWALRTYAPLHHVPTGGPWSFTQPNTYAASPTTPGSAPQDAAAGAQRLLLAYLRAFGPASAQDFARFTLLGRPVIAQALHDLGDQVVRVTGPDRAVLFDLAGATVPVEDTHAPPRLLPMWDSTLLAHTLPGRVMPQEYRPLVVRRNGDILPTLLVDGQVAGVWRAADGGLELTTFRKLGKAAWHGLTDEAEQLSALLADRDPAVYRRYRHWWDKGIPAAETRMVKD
ncbi:winged helix DNA-binding domain-containing protein [Streptomyces rhizosphaerihabitans]|uniref:winged helix DNA-binding domain-containing protein n=1 Tax=Streptomyces rhizosphaerihabitans TaxID=1266770 RepID=UPI0021BF5FE0|nr:winged helix DNA-binding domain-containing protein [Streptomyces rhizosphaerihabitans]MCT9008977.1 winged helix DNA-binding domain-containing protein [Streptomyces rhizosphaerihabitans]